MSYQMTFKRYELKYLLTRPQKEAVLQAMEPYMSLDQYGRTTIRNIYYDTGSYRLVRRSIERPSYKEKLRLRSYRQAGAEESIFVELKKKYQSVVYKRRMVLPQERAMDWIGGGDPLPIHSQIASEIQYFCDYYGDLSPAAFLTYEREAYATRDDSGLRVTLDENILTRSHDFSFDQGIYGTPLLEKGATLMEIKTAGGLPMWMVRCLSENKIFKTSFSKYGTAYQKTMMPQGQEGVLHA